MDVTFTNVLEGARQYFQGLPAGSGSRASPAFSDSHNRNENEHNPSRDRPPSLGTYWPQAQDQQRPSTREPTPVQQRPSSHSSDTAGPPPSLHPQYMANELNRLTHYQSSYHHEPPTSQTQFQFSRPHSREVTSNHNVQYQPHITTNATYRQNPSPSRIQTPRSQEPQVIHPMQSVQLYQNYPHSRQYPVPPQSKPINTVPNTSMSGTSHQGYQNSQNAYYKQAYLAQHQNSLPNVQNSQMQRHPEVKTSSNASIPVRSEHFKTTHNLPPIAALASINCNARSNREPVRTNDSRARTASISIPPASCSYQQQQQQQQQPISNANVIRNNVSLPYSSYSYNQYRNVSTHSSQPQSNQNYQYVTTSTTQSYNSIIMASSTTGGSFSSTHQSSNQYHQSNINNSLAPPPTTTQAPLNVLSNHQSNIPQTQHAVDVNANGRLAPILKPKKESPLDLSVKTVRTSADSTLDDAENDVGLKYYSRTRPSAHLSISAHSYPQHDVNSFQRNLTERSSQPQPVPSASVPKVEFHPDFTIPSSLNQPRGFPPADVQRHTTVINKAHSSSRMYPPNHPNQSNIANRYPTVPISSAQLTSHLINKNPEMPRVTPNLPNNIKQSSQMYNQELNKKRVAEAGPPAIPKKITKIDPWRQSIDNEIDQRFLSYQQDQQEKSKTGVNENVHNGGYPLVKKESYSVRQPYPNPIPYTSYHQNKHNQTYVPSAASHQYPGYSPSFTNHHQQQQQQQQHQPQQPGYQYPLSRSNSTSSMYTAKHNLGGGADKRVLSLLRNSLEVKELKKLEQSKLQENAQHLRRSDIQHPSTDVTAPMQPKPGFISRNNVSPFTPTSFPDTSNGMAMYKFHMPKAIDSVNYNLDNKNLNMDIKSNADMQTILLNNSSNNEYDGLAALVAARIRTKGELKQGGITANNAPGKNFPSFIESQLKSPYRQETNSSFGSSSTNTSVSPPKLLKERASLIPPRRRLFSKTEEEMSSNNVPHRDKSGLRSSSETSIYDFPDSDSENDTERRSLHAMRKERKPKPNVPNSEIKLDSPKPPSPGDDMFAHMCDNFMDQLKNGGGKKKGRRKKVVPLDVPVKIEEPTTKENPVSNEIVIKTEPVDDTVTNDEEVANEKQTDDDDEMNMPLERYIEKENKLIVKLEQFDEVEKNNDLAVGGINKRNIRRLVSTSESETEPEKLVSSVNKESKYIKKEEIDNTTNNKIETSLTNKNDKTVKLDIPTITRPAKKPSFGDGSDFYPGWEESVYKYKKSLRMPPSLIQVSRPPQFHRLSTSLPDLDPTPHSPTPSVTTESESSKKMHKVKSENLDSDVDSNCSFNLFSKHNSYDSEGGSSIKSLPNTAKEGNSILDKLLEKCGGRKKRKHKKKDDGLPKVIPKAENPVELLPTPSLEIKKLEEDKKQITPIIKSESAILGFRKKTMENFKDEFIKSASNILGVNKFATVVLSSRTRNESRVLKQRATIKEVFGDDRPASAPPTTCVNEVRIKEEVIEKPVKIEPKAEVKNNETFQTEPVDTKQMLKNKILNKGKKRISINEFDKDKKIKIEVHDEVDDEEDIMKNILNERNPEVKSETPSIDDEGSISGKKKSKLRIIRRKFSSGFDYIRKKKKTKKEETESSAVRIKRRGGPPKASPESVQDIQKEIKTWVLNKGIGETHLHRAARLGFTDITAYCLEKMDCIPSPKDNAGYTPLHEACSRGHLDIAKLLLMYGANASESAQGGIRPLHEAVENGFVEIVRLLLSYGADPSLATYAGVTPMALAKDEVTLQLLQDHLNDIQGNPGPIWQFPAVYSENDVCESGYNIFDGVPDPDPPSEEDEIEFEMSEILLPNLYTLRGEPSGDRWILLQDLSTLLKIKSRDALLKQIYPSSSSSSQVNVKSVLRELKMTDFLEQAHCCQFLNAGEKINTRASKIALVKYTEKVKELLNVDTVIITTR
ncbi:unnamed protein product [Brassicogethes aeneus]|uniref:BCL-6 corepressor n=1 Tax=Brassicogethes aeneus TaxID=1431903 RepID=A0A9P0B183_BRAAE|nr:unnamed protein product [Brassicogethes aeneus]